jgi:hypothetical protein
VLAAEIIYQIRSAGATEVNDKYKVVVAFHEPEFGPAANCSYSPPVKTLALVNHVWADPIRRWRRFVDQNHRRSYKTDRHRHLPLRPCGYPARLGVGCRSRCFPFHPLLLVMDKPSSGARCRLGKIDLEAALKEFSLWNGRIVESGTHEQRLFCSTQKATRAIHVVGTLVSRPCGVEAERPYAATGDLFVVHDDKDPSERYH